MKGHKKWCLVSFLQFKTVIKLKKSTFNMSYHEWMFFCSSPFFWKHSVSAASLGSPAPSSGEEVLPCHGDFSTCRQTQQPYQSVCMMDVSRYDQNTV